MTDDPALPPPQILRDADVGGNGWMLLIGTTEQSYVDLDDPTHLEFDYVQRIAGAIDLVAPRGQRIRVVHVGGAGMTLPRYIAHTRPTSAQLVLEPDADQTALVRGRLPLPKQSGIKVRAVDGLNGIAALRDDYADVVVLDAFHGAQVPAELTTVEFFADCHRVLDHGWLMINITDSGKLGYSRRVVAAVRTVFRNVVLSAEPSTFKGRRFGNLVIVATDRAPDLAALERSARQGAFPYRVLAGEALERFVAGAVPFAGADRAPSPPPPRGRGGLG